MVLAALMIGCAGSAAGPTPLPQSTATLPAADTPEAPTATPEVAVTLTPPAADATSLPQDTATPAVTPTAEPTEVTTRVTLAVLEDSRARYLVREQFARLDFSTDAVGETSEVSGAIVIDGDGVVRPEASMLVVDLRTLRSDDADRDDYLRWESLESDRYPLAEFEVQETPGLPWPLPQEGEATFQMVGEMTLHNYTRPLTWEVTAEFSPNQVIGTARTNFTFGTFHMVRPSRLFLLSVDDNIRLELDFVVEVSEAEDG
jgi:polyisoprenoid-binding protein YceI